jgi:NodT family efflux transporter outer membrane factor (OMF) lipoprotein
MQLKTLFAIALLATTSACVSVPASDTVANAPVPPAWRSAGAESEANPGLAAWWDAFADDTLRMLIERALAANYDLKAAVERSRRAEALIGVARSALFPDLNLRASALKERVNVPPPAGDVSDSAAGLGGSWTIDVFGANHLAVLAATAQASATDEARRDFEVALTASVGTVYVQLRGLQRELEILEDNIATRADTLSLIDARYRAGLASDLDVARAETQLRQAEAAVPDVRRLIDNAVGALSVLIGEQPEAPLPALLATAPIPAVGPELPKQAPGELLERRPDLRAAARRIDAAAAQAGVARAERLPTFALSFAGVADRLVFRDLAAVSDGLFHVGLGTVWPLFNGGRIRSNITAADADLRSAEYAFDQTLLGALQDVETAYTDVRSQRERRDRLTDAVASARRSSELARELYSAGTTDFFSVLDAHTQVLDSERDLARAQTEAAVSSVALYRALGGGWRTAVPASTSGPASETVSWNPGSARSRARRSGRDAREDGRDAKPIDGFARVER